VSGYRRYAVGGMVGGALTSIAANVLHTFVPPDDWPKSAEYAPEVGAIVGAIVWPLALLVASEVLARKRWASKRTRMVGTVAVLVVALVAAVISYQHLHALLLHYHETELSAALGPLAIDGLMIVCSVALVARDAEARESAPCPEVPAQESAPEVEVPGREGVALPGPSLVATGPEVPSHEGVAPVNAPAEPVNGSAEPVAAQPRKAIAAAHVARRKATTAATDNDRTDGALLARIRADITAGELPDPLTPTSVRNRYGVGKPRAERLVEATAGSEQS